ncbi:WecB/TagA/CpsF family glycosyltransferase, partial [Gottfriedia acidiceleris]|uniref:WecB/TagA/CpsF family glycosyltransferase n=1 Tax=Gottfriedia acidiceleris TaxID=371036 RepID=UPI002FFF991F
MSFLGIDLFIGTQKELVENLIINTENKLKKCYFAINPDCVLKYFENEDYKKMLLNKENTIYVDGIGVIYTQKFLKLPVAKERIATTDLFHELIETLSNKKSNLKVFLLGGKGDTAKRVIDNFSQKYPNIKFCGYRDGFFTPEEEDNVIKQINNSRTDILFVGFGTPLQEKWIDKNYEKLNVKTFITCGGLFDYYSGNVKRAPSLVRKLGLEWLFRLGQEPKRLYKRYIFGNIKFLGKILLLKLKGQGIE